MKFNTVTQKVKVLPQNGYDYREASFAAWQETVRMKPKQQANRPKRESPK